MIRTPLAPRSWLPLLGILFSSCLCGAGFEVRVQIQDPKGKELAEPGRLLCTEWYPKINALLFGPGTELPFQEVTLVFEDSIVSNSGQQHTVVPAYTSGNKIHVNSAYVSELHKQLPADYSGMMIHELTHVNQHYGNNSGAGWLVEGIADYVRHKYFEKDIEPRLPLNSNGELPGDSDKNSFATEGYRRGYTITGPFLYWLELRKNKEIVGILNRALRESRYSDKLFQEQCGFSLGVLWQEFVTQSKPGRALP